MLFSAVLYRWEDTREWSKCFLIKMIVEEDL